MGTIRGDFGQVSGRNVVHGADSVASASREIALWFTDTEMMEWDLCLNPWIHDHWLIIDEYVDNIIVYAMKSFNSDEDKLDSSTYSSSTFNL